MFVSGVHATVIVLVVRAVIVGVATAGKGVRKVMGAVEVPSVGVAALVTAYTRRAYSLPAKRVFKVVLVLWEPVVVATVALLMSFLTT